ncbi:MAG: restriction endonuclease subunit S [Armatimonadetes bacterium]|nr:restriction endonuclease subunit S [Armatimonadota bacterium]
MGALDDKIELNRRMNETLEAMARAIFKSWFVDFDPVHAKARGEKPFGMNEETAALFPSKFTDSPLGPIPQGWEVKPLSALADFRNGLAMQKYPARDGEPSIPVVKIAELRGGLSANAQRANLDVPPAYVVSDGDLLFSWSGSLMVKTWAEGKAALNQHLFLVVPRNVPQWFLHCWLLEHLEDFQAIAASKATTMGHIQRHHLEDALCLVPAAGMSVAADATISPFASLVLSNLIVARRLANLRDLLLPMLLSGR